MKYVYDLVKKYGVNSHIDLILKKEAEYRDFTATVIVDNFKYHIECPTPILPYIKILDFYGYKFIPQEHLIDFKTGDYLYTPEAEIADIENSRLVEHVSWKTIIDMLTYEDYEFLYGKCEKTFALSKKYNIKINTFIHYIDGEPFVFIGYLRLWKYGEKKNNNIKNDIMNIGWDFTDDHYYVKNDPANFYIGVACLTLYVIICGIPLLFTAIGLISRFAV